MLSVCTTTQRVMHADRKTKFSLSTLTLPRYLYTSPYCNATLWKQLMVKSTEENPHLIKEHIFVISEDPVQDHDSVHTCQALIAKYLLDISCKVDRMHEFTDGCAAQYKSRHCVGDLSCSLADFGFIIQRNYFETWHAKGEQDAAGSHVKQKVSQAVRTRSATINSAKLCTSF